MNLQKYISLAFPILISAINLGVFLEPRKSQAQLIPDNSLGSESSVITPQDTLNDLIEGGAIRGNNLFHSFSEFNIPEARGAIFANPEGVENILNRVTGGNPSNIFGRLSVAGNANLFLINPAGVIFGPNAILDVSGSLTVTTADGIQLGEGGFFSATNLEGSSLLSVSPSALFFNQVASQATGNIIVNSSLNNVSGNSNLSLLSINDITIENPLNLPAGNGRVELKADVDENLTGDLIVTNPADGIVTNGRDLNLEGANLIIGNIDASSDTEAGDITLNASQNISTGNLSSDLFAQTNDTGNGGAITLEAGGDINTGNIRSYTGSYSGNSENGGAITLESGGNITVANLDSRSVSGTNTGNGGAITLEAGGDINTGNLDSEAFSYYANSVAGNGGEITLEAGGDINTQGGLDSRSFNNQGIVGDGGAIKIEADGDINVSSGILTTSVRDDSNSNPLGSGGNILISSGNNISLSNDNILANGAPSGSITIESPNTISIDGILVQSIHSGSGTGGNLEITTNSLIITNNSDVSTLTFGEGMAGDVTIDATNSIIIDNSILSSVVGSGVQFIAQASGNGGNVMIETPQLSVINGGQVVTNTFSTGNAGNLSIKVDESILIDGIGTDTAGSLRTSGLFSGSINNGTGNGGNINIETGSIIVSNDAEINTNTQETGNAGNINIDAGEFIVVDRAIIDSGVISGTGTGGDINLDVSEGNLSLTNGGRITITTEGDGNAGNANIVTQSIVLDGTGIVIDDDIEADNNVDTVEVDSGIFSESFGENTIGNGGTIVINTNSLAVNNQATINAESQGFGNGGNIDINATENIEINNGEIISDSTGTGLAGNISITTEGNIIGNAATISATSLQTGGGDINIDASEVEIENSSLISTSVFNGDGGGGDITITTVQFTALEDSDILANAIEGAGGNITIDANTLIADVFTNNGPDSSLDVSDFSLFRGNGRVDISASSESGVDGTVTIPDITFIENSLIGLDAAVVTPEQIVSGSCIARQTPGRPTFTASGTDSLPDNPFQRLTGQYELIGVNNIGGNSGDTVSGEKIPNDYSWQIGDSVVEAGGLIVTNSGKVMLDSRDRITEIAKANDLVCN